MPTIDLDAPVEVRLEAGAAPGTFHLVCRGRATWAGTPEWPVTVTLGNRSGAVAAVAQVADEQAFTLEADVGPGVWSVVSEPAADAAERWWTALGPVLDVESTGVVRCASNCGQGVYHARKLELSWPDPLEVVANRRPTLRWVGLPDADHYGVRWFELPTDRGKFKPADEVWATLYPFPVNLVAERVYQWHVDAFDAAGKRIGGMNGTFLTPGGRLDAIAPTWLGVELVNVRGRGVVVGSVVPGSPAEAAGFRAGMVVVSFGGAPVVDEAQLREAIGRVPAGTAVDIVVSDADGRRTLRPTLAARPTR